MKKVLVSLLVGITIVGLIGCGSKEVEGDKQVSEENKQIAEEVQEVEDTEEKTEIEEEDYYLENEMVECTSPQIEGKYYISLSAKVVPPLMGGDRDEAIQINMEVYNESFKGSTSYNGEVLIDIVMPDLSSSTGTVKVKDENNHILTECMGIIGEEITLPVPISIGESATISNVYPMVDGDYIYVKYLRLDKEFKLKINR